jgi:hypothetical protein
MSVVAETVAQLAAAVGVSAALAVLITRRDPGPLARRDRAGRTARQRAQDDRDLLRLAHNSRRKDRTPMIPAPLANDERSPDWCHRHGCHRSQCPGPE